MEILVKGFIIHKEAEQYSCCADRYATKQVDDESYKFAISDGVTRSFFPKFWAEVLVDEYVNWDREKQYVEEDFISLCQEKWFNKVSKIVDSRAAWYVQNAYKLKKPALATFACLNIFSGEDGCWKWEAKARGDSFLIFVPKGEKGGSENIVVLPSIEQYGSDKVLLGNYPDYFSSIGNLHKGETIEKSGKIENGTFYLLTDALFEWLINNQEDAFDKVNSWEEPDDFQNFIDKSRKEKLITDDDCSILIISIDNYKSNMQGGSIEYTVNVMDIDKKIQKELEVIAKSSSKDKQPLLKEEEKEGEKSVSFSRRELISDDMEHVNNNDEE